MTERYRDVEKRRAYYRERMRLRRLWEGKRPEYRFFREWVTLFVAIMARV